MPSKKTKKDSKTGKKKISQAEFEKGVIELANKGLTSEKIGERLRQEGIHPREYEKKISKILKEKGKYINPDLRSTEEKLERVRAYFEKNKQDKRALRDKERIAARLRKLKNYFKIK